MLQGYVVVAPDYAGLGVDRDAKGNPIIHQYLSSPSHANDLFYSVQAAQTASKSLSKQFVVMGHSQGGGAAWAAAQRQALPPVDGYLGSIAGSPATDALDIMEKIDSSVSGGYVALFTRALTSVFPGFDTGTILTKAGLKRLELLEPIQGCNSVNLELFSTAGLVQPDWSKFYYASAFAKLTSNGGKPIAGPLLIPQGDADTLTHANGTSTAMN